MSLAPGSLSDPWGLRKCAWNNPSRQWGLGHLHPSHPQHPPASLPWAHTPGSGARNRLFLGPEEGLASGAPLSPCSCAPGPCESPSAECLTWERVCARKLLAKQPESWKERVPGGQSQLPPAHFSFWSPLLSAITVPWVPEALPDHYSPWPWLRFPSPHPWGSPEGVNTPRACGAYSPQRQVQSGLGTPKARPPGTMLPSWVPQGSRAWLPTLFYSLLSNSLLSPYRTPMLLVLHNHSYVFNTYPLKYLL